MPNWDAAIVGLGAMGSMAAWRMASRGLRVVGIEQHGIGHSRGASGGETRIFRLAYKEGSWYVPLLREARGMWEELSRSSGRELLVSSGALTIGSPEEPDVAAVLDSAQQHDLPHEVLTAREARDRFPQHRMRDHEIVVHDPAGGLLHPEASVQAATALAAEHGAQIRPSTRCLRVEETDNGVAVHTDQGVVEAGQVLLCAGPWTHQLLPGAGFEIRRVILHWFRAEQPEKFAPGEFPVGIRRSGPGKNLSFFPAVKDGLVKVNLHVPKEAVPDIDAFTHEVAPEHTRQVESSVADLFNGLQPNHVRARAFAEGYTPDNTALIGRPPGSRRQLAMSGFSGHGFKLSPVFGEIAADLIADGSSDRDITPFSPDREHQQ